MLKFYSYFFLLFSLREEILKNTQNFHDNQYEQEQIEEERDKDTEENVDDKSKSIEKNQEKDNIFKFDLQEGEEKTVKESRKNLLLYRKLQSIRLLGELLNRVKVRVHFFFVSFLEAE